MDYGNRNSGFWGSLVTYFDQHGLFTQWYWPEDCRGRIWNLFHGRGWRIG